MAPIMRPWLSIYVSVLGARRCAGLKADNKQTLTPLPLKTLLIFIILLELSMGRDMGVLKRSRAL